MQHKLNFYAVRIRFLRSMKARNQKKYGKANTKYNLNIS